MYVRQYKKHTQSQFIEIKPEGETSVKIKNSDLDFGGYNMPVFMKADASSKLSFYGVEYSGIGELTWYDKGAKAVFNSEQ
jgi:hypothetical protein